MAYNIRYSDYPTSEGPPDPLRWVGPPGPPGPPGPVGPQGTQAIVYTADAAPAGAQDSTLWWDSAGTGLYIRYNDGNSTQWVATQNPYTLTEAPRDGATYGRMNGTWTSALALSGGTITGPLTLAANATQPMHAVPLQQLTAAVTVSVKTYGAKGDGTTNDTAGIQAAANAISASGGILLFPPGVYAVTAPITVPSNTLVQGQGATLLAVTGFPAVQALITNVNFAATVLTDHDIAVQNITLDYGSSGAGGAAHALQFTFVRNVAVSGCTIQCRGAGNAVAFTGCYNSLVSGCSAYGFTNCAWDHWWKPQKARVIGCYAETSVSNQFVNFNPEQTTGSSAGFTATGFVMTGCEMLCTGSNASAMQIEPLGAGTTVSDVVITGNTFVNTWLAIRGAINAVTVANNAFDSVAGGSPAIMSFAQNGGTPNNLTITGNAITNAATNAGNAGAIYVAVNNAAIVGNTVDNVTGGGNAIFTGAATPVVSGNFCATPGQVYTPNAVAQTGPLSGPFAGALACGSAVGSSNIDLSHHIALYGTQYGFNVTAGEINYVAPSAAVHAFLVNGVQVAAIGASGIMTGPAGSPTWTTGSTAPAATAPVGSLYSRTDGAVGTTLYVSRGGGTWNAVAGV